MKFSLSLPCQNSFSTVAALCVNINGFGGHLHVILYTSFCVQVQRSVRKGNFLLRGWWRPRWGQCGCWLCYAPVNLCCFLDVRLCGQPPSSSTFFPSRCVWGGTEANGWAPLAASSSWHRSALMDLLGSLQRTELPSEVMVFAAWAPVIVIEVWLLLASSRAEGVIDP